MNTSSDNSRNDNLFLVGMILSMFCWGLSWASGKILAGYGGALNISLFRFALTFFSLLIMLLVSRQNLQVQRKGWFDLFCAAVGIGLYTYFFFKGLTLGKAGAGGVLVTTLNPIVSYLLMLLLAQRMPTRNEALGIIAGVAAGAVLLKVWDNAGGLWNAGNTYFLLASFTWAILSLFTAKSSRYGSPVSFSLWMYGLCSLIILLITGWNDNVLVIEKADIYFWGNLFFSATITTSLATTFYFVATTKIGASKASSFIFLVPCSAALGSWVFLGEVPQWHTIAGGVLGIAAVYILNRRR